MVGPANTPTTKPLVLLLLNSSSEPPLLPLPSRHFATESSPQHPAPFRDPITTSLPPLLALAYQPLLGYQYLMPHQVPLRTGLISEQGHNSAPSSQPSSTKPRDAHVYPAHDSPSHDHQAGFMPPMGHSPPIGYSAPPSAPYVMMAPVPMATLGHAGTPMMPHAQGPPGIPIAGAPFPGAPHPHHPHHLPQNPQHIYQHMGPAMGSVAPAMAPVMAPTAPQLPNKHRRFRRRYYQINRKYKCTHPGCTKSYGSLNHLNTHIVTKKHGARKSKADFKHHEEQQKQQEQNQHQSQQPQDEQEDNKSHLKESSGSEQPDVQPPTPPLSNPSYERYAGGGVPSGHEKPGSKHSVSPSTNTALPSPMSSSATLPKISAITKDQVRLPSLPAIVGQFQN